MPPTRDHQNKPLISLTDGKKVGEVKDVYLDAELNRVTAVFLGKEGLLNRKALLIDKAHITVMGIDAWLVSGADKVANAESVPGAESWMLAGDLRGREIITEGGTRVGTIGDVVINEQGQVLGFAFDKVLVQGPLSDSKRIARGAITSIGGRTNAMTTELAQAEKMKMADEA
jgi:uncharacterized protein YrrD